MARYNLRRYRARVGGPRQTNYGTIGTTRIRAVYIILLSYIIVWIIPPKHRGLCHQHGNPPRFGIIISTQNSTTNSRHHNQRIVQHSSRKLPDNPAPDAWNGIGPGIKILPVVDNLLLPGLYIINDKPKAIKI